MPKTTRKLAIAKGTTVFAPGQPCPGFVLLDSGTIRVSLTAENGRHVVLYRVGPGDICLQTFSCLINNSAYSAEGVAETDLGGIVLPPDAFFDRLERDPDFRARVFGAVARRFADFEQLVEDVALSGFDARLARALLRLSDAAGQLHTTHEQLASEVASGRAAVTRQLSDFSRDGLVRLARGEITVVDRAGLEQIAADPV